MKIKYYASDNVMKLLSKEEIISYLDDRREREEDDFYIYQDDMYNMCIETLNDEECAVNEVCEVEF